MSDPEKKHIRNMETSPWKGNNLPEGYKTFTVKTEIPKDLPLLEQAAVGAKISKNARQKLEKALLESGIDDGVLTIGSAESSGTFKIVGRKEAVEQLLISVPDLKLCE
jgi:hypothetical protein